MVFNVSLDAISSALITFNCKYTYIFKKIPLAITYVNYAN